MNLPFFIFFIALLIVFCLFHLLQIKKQHETFVDNTTTFIDNCNTCKTSFSEMQTNKVVLPYSYDINYQIEGKVINSVKDLRCLSLKNNPIRGKACEAYFINKMNPSILISEDNEKIETLIIPCLDLLYCKKKNCVGKQLINDQKLITHVEMMFTKVGQTVTVRIPLLGKQKASQVFFSPVKPDREMLRFKSSISKDLITGGGVTFESTVYTKISDLLTAFGNYQYQALLGNVIPYSVTVTFVNEATT